MTIHFKVVRVNRGRPYSRNIRKLHRKSDIALSPLLKEIQRRKLLKEMRYPFHINLNFMKAPPVAKRVIPFPMKPSANPLRTKFNVSLTKRNPYPDLKRVYIRKYDIDIDPSGVPFDSERLPVIKDRIDRFINNRNFDVTDSRLKELLNNKAVLSLLALPKEYDDYVRDVISTQIELKEDGDKDEMEDYEEVVMN